MITELKSMVLVPAEVLSEMWAEGEGGRTRAACGRMSPRACAPLRMAGFRGMQSGAMHGCRDLSPAISARNEKEPLTMNRSASQAARILGVDVEQVKKWAYLFKEYLTPSANPPKGRARAFSDSDLLVLGHVGRCWEDEPDLESIKFGVNQEDHFDERSMGILYMNTHLLQEPPDDLDETWRNGVLLCGGGVDAYLELARNYRQGAEALLDMALESGEPSDWGYPVLFEYRHALELYLKIIGEISKHTHRLRECVELVEQRYGKTICSPIREWILELDKIDPGATAFRYADDEARTLACAEYWVDFAQFKFAMNKVFELIDSAILNRSGIPGGSIRGR